jgi:hypothetical protein
VEATPHAKLPLPPATVLQLPDATFTLPEPINEYDPLAVLKYPPVTAAYPFEAVFNCPPAIVE